MEALDKLKEIGAKEIAQNTHIAINRVEDILKKDFSSLKDKTSTIGLVHILEREYSLDLSEWVSEYEGFLKENGLEEKEDLEGSIQLKITHEVTENRKDKGGMIIIAVILILCGIGFYVYNNFSTSLTKEENATEINTTAQTKEENITTQSEEQTLPLKENNQTALPQVAEDLSSSTPINSPLEQAKESQIIQAPTAFEIRPKGNMWIGIFYLDNHQKVSLTTDKSIEIDTKREQVFITGHGMLEMGEGENLQNYNQATKMRFYVDKEGKVAPINYTEYMRLSGGAGW
ncbi:hypothetical protein [Helicobacter burdigaliensis]|uniref:hypothetical protein n=1 Tax=Helicobacter burdigaliensis TaxID=2315334 RepID=UPI000EF718B7|nr:hypothetical protein [Helicobacter burdigaliensis]